MRTHAEGGHQVKFVTWKPAAVSNGDLGIEPFPGKRRRCRDDKWHILFYTLFSFLLLSGFSEFVSLYWSSFYLPLAAVQLNRRICSIAHSLHFYQYQLEKTVVFGSYGQFTNRIAVRVLIQHLQHAWHGTIRPDFAEMEGPCQRMIIRFDTSTLFASRPLVLLLCPYQFDVAALFCVWEAFHLFYNKFSGH